MQNIIVIPARGGSKGIERKNMALLNGRPLIEYTLQSILHLKYNWRICVSSDDPSILKYVEDRGFEVYFKRSESLAQDNSTTLDVVKDAVTKYEDIFGEEYNLVMTLQPTSPLRRSLHIDEALKLINQNEDCNSLVSVMNVPHQFGYESLMELKPDKFISPLDSFKDLSLNRHNKKQYLARNGAGIYITRRHILRYGLFYPKCIPYFMNKIDSIDIDDLEDLTIAEAIMVNSKDLHYKVP